MSTFRMRTWCVLGVLHAAIGAHGLLWADEQDAAPDDDDTKTNWNIESPTLGGKQLWADELVHGAWRIQKNVVSGHFRLLDADNKRRAWGTWEQCERQWQELQKAENIPPLKPKVVLVLHGLGRSRASMANMVAYLSQHGDFDVMNISYASTRVPLEEDARSLARVVGRLQGVEEICFVTHSMGSLVVRHLLHDQLTASRGMGIDARIRRIVMLAPPNNGSSLAERFKYDPVFHVVFGTGGREFVWQWSRVQERLATPSCPFGIIAGGSADRAGRNPLLEGDDDMVVTIDETRLAGAADFVVVPTLHTFIMDNPQVQEYTLRFLQHGYFISEEARRPLPAETPKADKGP